MIISEIYKITNTLNDKVYIGQSTNIQSRWAYHISTLNTKNHSNKHLQNACNKDGQEAFRFETVMIVVDERCLDSAEEGWFYLTKCCDPRYGYNKATYADVPARGRKMSNETKAKIRASVMESLTDEAKAKISARLKGNKYGCGNKGKHHSPETKAKMATKRSAETRAKISVAARKREALKRQNKQPKPTIGIVKETQNGED